MRKLHTLALACVLAAFCFTLHAAAQEPVALNITIGEARNMFAPTRAFEQMRLSIFNSQGELVYGAATNEAELSYALKTNNGDALMPGLYAYVLALKYGENNEREHKGNFIIERGGEQLWLTTKDNDEISGTSLTATRTGGRTLVGTGTGGQRDVSGRAVTTTAGTQTTEDGKSAKLLPSAVLGTPNKLM
jgi:hypothetical protein